METPVLLDEKFLTHDDENLETFSLVWLMTEVNNSEQSRDIQQKLRAIINHLKIFDDVEKYLKYIESVSQDDRLVLIVDDRFATQVVPRIHSLQQVSSIYLYSAGETKNKTWAKGLQKIRTITSRLDKVISQVEFDQKIRMKVEPLSIKLFDRNNDASVSMIKFDKTCVHFQVLIDILLRMRSNDKDQNEFISLCKKEYKGNKNQLAAIRDFTRNYNADNALEWYTRQSFLQKILNKALRVQNIGVLYLFRSFIRHMHHQLQCSPCQYPIRVYKGQLMSNDDLNIFKSSLGKFISVNSFLLANDDRELVLSHLDATTSSKNVQRVLFEIDADPGKGMMKLFAKIDSVCDSTTEAEIIFMLGSIFRITGIRRDNSRRWIIQLTLCGDDEQDLKQIFDYMLNEYGHGEANLLSLGTVLRDMGEFDLAEKYFSRMLAELPANDPQLGGLYTALGMVAKDRGDYDKSLQWYHKALEIYMLIRPSDYVTIGDTYNTLGMIYYESKGACNRALVYYKEAISLFNKVHAEIHPMMAIFYDNIGAIYEEQKNYSDAIISYKKSLTIRKKHLPANHPGLGRSHNNVAAMYGYLKSYDLALKHYRKALKIQSRSLPAHHPDIALTYANMASVYAMKNWLQLALAYWHRASTIFRDTLLPQHPLVMKMEEEIRRVSPRLGYYSSTKKITKNRVTPI